MIENPMKDLRGSELDQELVSRKLTGVYATLSIDVPWNHFDNMVDIIESDVEDVNPPIDRNSIASNPKVIKHFENAVMRAFNDCNWDNDLDDYSYDAGSAIYGKEIQAAADDKERKRQEALAARQAEMEAKAAIIHVPTKMAKKARAILLAAGILKE